MKFGSPEHLAWLSEPLVLSDNVLFLADSYKDTHWKQYPKRTTRVYDYYESRGGKWHDMVFFGAQYMMLRYLVGRVVTPLKIDEAENDAAMHFNDPTIFNRADWDYIAKVHDGFLPLRICAVPEGTPVPVQNVVMTVENTDPRCYWLPGYLESLLVQSWYPCTVATQSREMKALLLKYLKRTGDPSLIDFKLHDFGFRGVSSVETAEIGGAAHLVNFKGTDTRIANRLLRHYYNEPMAGFSIPAAEHRTMSAWGWIGEEDGMANMLDQFPEGAVSVISDTYDVFEACRMILGEKLRDKILGRKGVVIPRPDSGDPPEVLATGDPNLCDILWEKFGGQTNEKGFRVFDPHIRLIQGDKVNLEMLDRILYAMQQKGYSADNIAFGSGGGLLQQLNRDTQQYAAKGSWAEIDGQGRSIYKDPATGSGKRSKRGRLKLLCRDGRYATVPEDAPGQDCLVEVFRNGKMRKLYTLSEVRERAALA